jgi:capsular exopolysaccharide synthesis family protein
VDPLEKALAKARKQQGSRQLDAPDQPVEVLSTAGDGPVLQAVEPRGPKTGLSELRYKNTRVVPVPNRTLNKYRLVAGESYNSVADRYKMLRVQVLRKLSQSGARTLGIFSANTGAGKSLTAANLAISVALDPNHTVLLVDLDLRRPTLHKYFDLNGGPALADYFEGDADLEECLVSPGIGRLVVLPVGRPVRNSSEVLASTRTTELIQELGSRYPDRIVIFDLPPLLIGDDALVVLANIHAALLVVREGKSQAGEIQACLSMLEGHQLLGTVLNCSHDDNLYPYY